MARMWEREVRSAGFAIREPRATGLSDTRA